MLFATYRTHLKVNLTLLIMSVPINKIPPFIGNNNQNEKHVMLRSVEQSYTIGDKVFYCHDLDLIENVLIKSCSRG